MPESTSISQRRSGRLSQRAGGSIYSETVGRDRGERLLSRSLRGAFRCIVQATPICLFARLDREVAFPLNADAASPSHQELPHQALS